MSLRPQIVNPVPSETAPETARVAKAAFPKGNLYITMRDELGTLYTDKDLEALFSTTGQPAACPWRLALTCVMQFIAGLSDRQSAEAVLRRIDWKNALGLELTDPGFDFSVNSEFRARLIAGGQEQMLLDTLLELCLNRGWLKARGKQRTDSTHVLGAIRTLNRLECVGETLRAALNTLAIVAPEWLLTQVAKEWFDCGCRPVEEYHLPKGIEARLDYAETIGRDGMQLLTAVYEDTTAPSWLRQLQV